MNKYLSIKEAAKAININPANILTYLRNNQQKLQLHAAGVNTYLDEIIIHKLFS